MDRPLLTIYIPTYNRSGHLKRNLDFLSEEIKNLASLDDIEIIISDNASDDNTQEVIASFKKQCPEGLALTLNRNPNSIGLIGNLLYGYKNSRGFYHWTMGDDDYYRPGIINKILSACDHKAAHIYINNSAFIHNPGDNLGYLSSLQQIDISAKNPIIELAKKLPGCLMFISANVYREDLLKTVIKKRIRNNICFPMFISFYCLSKGPTSIISDILIDDNYRDISWKNDTYHVYRYALPKIVRKICRMPIDKELKAELKLKFCKGVRLENFKDHCRNCLKSIGLYNIFRKILGKR